MFCYISASFVDVLQCNGNPNLSSVRGKLSFLCCSVFTAAEYKSDSWWLAVTTSLQWRTTRLLFAWKIISLSSENFLHLQFSKMFPARILFIFYAKLFAVTCLFHIANITFPSVYLQYEICRMIIPKLYIYIINNAFLIKFEQIWYENSNSVWLPVQWERKVSKVTN